MAQQGKRLMMEPDGQVTIETFDVPEPGPDQILVRITTTQVSAGIGNLHEGQKLRARRDPQSRGGCLRLHP